MESLPPTRAAVARTALELLDDWGVAALSVQTVAGELDTTFEAVEAIAPDQSSLIDLACEQVYAEVEMFQTGTPWTQRFETYCASFRTALLRHPNAAISIATRPIVSESSMMVAEHALAELTEVGFDPQEANRILLVIVSFIVGHALTELGATTDLGGHLPARVAEFRQDLPERMPVAREALAAANDRDAEFELGLRLLIGGLERQLLHAAP